MDTESPLSTRFRWFLDKCKLAFTRVRDWLWAHKPIGVSIFLVLLLLLPLPFAAGYWTKLYFRAVGEAWMSVFKKGLGSIIILFLLWLIGIWHQHKEKWEEQLTVEVAKLITALKVPAAVFVLIFLVHLLGITPARMVADASRTQPGPVPFEVKVTSENKDPEARDELRKAKEQLLQVTNRLSETQTHLAASAEELHVLRERLRAQHFVPLSKENEKMFVQLLSDWFQRWPSITNISVVVDTTIKPRRLWAEQIARMTAKLPVVMSAGINTAAGNYDMVVFFRPGNEKAIEQLTQPLLLLFPKPIPIAPDPALPNPISVRLMGLPVFDTNGIIRFE